MNANRFLIVVMALLVLVVSKPAGGAIVFLRGEPEPIRGFLIRQTDDAVVIGIPQADGSIRERVFGRGEVEDVLLTVSTERLAALDESRPGEYRNYAEELAEKKDDPEARATAIRLFLIAAWLDPDRLGRSSLLGMVPLARSEEEQRQFRAMAYLLDPDHDRRILEAGGSATGDAATVTDATGIPAQILQMMRLLRQEKKRELLIIARQPDVAAGFEAAQKLITYRELVEAGENVGKCKWCTTGSVECKTCRGTRSIPGATPGSTTVCPDCGGIGRRLCEHCEGNFADVGVPRSLLRRALQLELQLTGGGSGPAVATESASADKADSSWAEKVQVDGGRPIAGLTLLTLTEFDPRKCHYRDGKWVEP